MTAHFDLRLLTKFFFAAILWSVASACRDRYFSSRDDAVKYLRAHEPNFERLAESWASDRPTHPGTFCNFKPDNYRWGGVFIRKVSNRYEVDRGGKKTDFATLEEAQRDAGADPTAFSFWSQLTEQNHVYCVEYGADETVEIMLAGSDWSPYGFRYAPKGDPHAYEALVSNARQGQTYNTDRYMEHVSGRWFYFEAKR